MQLFVVALLLASACHNNPTPTPGKIETIVSHNHEGQGAGSIVFTVNDDNPQRQRINCDLSVKEKEWGSDKNRKGSFNQSKQYEEHQRCINEGMADFDKVYLQKLVGVFLRAGLLAQPGAIVMASDAGRGHYQVKALVTEFVPDIDAAIRDKSLPQHLLGTGLAQAAPYAAAGTAGLLGPAGAVLSNFDLFTGIPTSWNSAEQRGFVGTDVKVIDAKSGRIVTSFRAAGIFTGQLKSLGKDWAGYHKRDLKSSSPAEALKTSLEEAAKKIIQSVPR